MQRSKPNSVSEYGSSMSSKYIESIMNNKRQMLTGPIFVSFLRDSTRSPNELPIRPIVKIKGGYIEYKKYLTPLISSIQTLFLFFKQIPSDLDSGSTQIYSKYSNFSKCGRINHFSQFCFFFFKQIKKISALRVMQIVFIFDFNQFFQK